MIFSNEVCFLVTTEQGLESSIKELASTDDGGMFHVSLDVVYDRLASPDELHFDNFKFILL